MFGRKQKETMLRRKPAQTLPRNAGVFSYHAARSRRTDNTGRDASQQQSSLDSRSQAQKQDKRSKRIFAFFVAAVLIAAAVNGLIVTPEPKISVAGDKNGQAFLQKGAVYQRAAADLAKSSVLNRNKLTFDSSGVSRRMLDKFPELETVSVSQSLLGRKPTVHIQAFKPRLILVSDSGTFVLSPEGRAFLPASQVPYMERFNLPVVNDQSGLIIREQDIALPEREVAFITEVNRQLKAKKVQVIGYKLLLGGSELEVQIKDQPYKVRFNLYGNAREGAGRYLATREYLDSRGETPQEYIDVRVDNHVYYR